MNKLFFLLLFILAATGLQAQSTQNYTLALCNEKGEKLNNEDNIIKMSEVKNARKITLQLFDSVGQKVAFSKAVIAGQGRANTSPTVFMDYPAGDGMFSDGMLEVMQNWGMGGQILGCVFEGNNLDVRAEFDVRP